MKLSKLLLATMGATVLLGALVGSASARVFSSSSQSLRTHFRTVTFRGGFGDIRCAVSLEGSLHSRSISKVARTLVGYINRAELGPCASGTATILRETLPWHGQYSSFGGTLPNITTITIHFINASFRVREPFLTCLARSTATNPAIGTFNRSVATRELTNARISGIIPTSCGIDGEFESTEDPVTTSTGARITVTLI